MMTMSAVTIMRPIGHGDDDKQNHQSPGHQSPGLGSGVHLDPGPSPGPGPLVGPHPPASHPVPGGSLSDGA